MKVCWIWTWLNDKSYKRVSKYLQDTIRSILHFVRVIYRCAPTASVVCWWETCAFCSVCFHQDMIGPLYECHLDAGCACPASIYWWRRDAHYLLWSASRRVPLCAHALHTWDAPNRYCYYYLLPRTHPSFHTWSNKMAVNHCYFEKLLPVH